jgi:Haem degrading protein HbpS-like
VDGGIITFGGGVALYRNGQVIGGLGVSGDTSCADHAVAYRMRAMAGLDKIPAGPNSSKTDNIEYLASGEPPDTGSKQPHCLSTDITP